MSALVPLAAAATGVKEIEIRVEGRSIACRLQQHVGRRYLLQVPTTVAELMPERTNQPVVLGIQEDGQWLEGAAVVRGWVWAQPALLAVELTDLLVPVARRKSPRLAHRLACRVEWEDGNPCEGQVQDLSATGARVLVGGHPTIESGSGGKLLMWTQEGRQLNAQPVTLRRLVRRFKSKSPSAELGLEFTRDGEGDFDLWLIRDER